jgi:hypothetical protein
MHILAFWHRRLVSLIVLANVVSRLCGQDIAHLVGLLDRHQFEVLGKFLEQLGRCCTFGQQRLIMKKLCHVAQRLPVPSFQIWRGR